ncbi:DNA-dependent RNA polymerase II [Lithohypha guttulata]|uniref:DNA-dependent RNA polymerase II n=1 Tax=Lithohypha guttulata TaxID=1690604 RepID=UPI002DE1572E|nr:DNA-dependent RNA polymerase II [Lithohypha guttulata]
MASINTLPPPTSSLKRKLNDPTTSFTRTASKKAAKHSEVDSPRGTPNTSSPNGSKTAFVQDEPEEEQVAGPALPPEDDIDEEVEDDEEGRFFGGGVSKKENDVLDYIEQNEDDDVEEEINLVWLKRTALNFERKTNKNAELRAKYEDDPTKFMSSEADLDSEIKSLSLLSEHSDLYKDFVRSGCSDSLVGLLAHDNTDIAIAATEVIADLIDEDSGASADDWSVLVKSMLKADLIGLLVSNLNRLDEKTESDNAGVYHVLSVIESLLSDTANAEKIGANAKFLKWLLQRIKQSDESASNKVGQNRQYAAEILVILAQTDVKNIERLVKLDAVDTILELLSAWRSRDPEKDSDEEEFAGNLFDCLVTLVKHASGRDEFIQKEGMELCLIMLKDGKFSKHGALRVLDHAADGFSGGPVYERLVDAGGLKQVFTALMKSKKLERESIEHLIGILSSLLRLLPPGSASRIRLLAKFVEKDYEKCNRLLELRKGYSDRLAAAEEQIEQEKKSLSPEDVEDTENEYLSRRMDAGLFPLQTLDIILAWLIAEDDGARKYILASISKDTGGMAKLRAITMAEYDVDGVYGDGEVAEYSDDQTLSEEDCWEVVTSFFHQKNLCALQIDSFNDFLTVSIQDLFNEKGRITVDQTENIADEDDPNPVVIKRHEIIFGGVTISRPSYTEGDGEISNMMPHEARLRSLTYAAPIFCTMERKTHLAKAKPWDVQSIDDSSMDDSGQVLYWRESREEGAHEPSQDIFVGNVPIMVKSSACHLVQPDMFPTEDELFAWGECPYDQGGYFIINGSEKVLIAQERSAGNIVQVFQKPSTSAFTHLAEIRSVIDKGNRIMSQCTVKLFRKGDGPDGTKIDGPIRVQLPYVKEDIPLTIVFRALDVMSDQDILEKICFDHRDKEMVDKLMGSIQEGQVIQSADVARDYIAKRSNNSGLRSSDRQKVAIDILTKEFLPHIGQTADATTRKAFFLGYMVSRMLKCALNRTEPDDRDHLGKKRIDLPGPLMTTLYRQQLDKACKDLQRYMEKKVQDGHPISLKAGFKPAILTNGLKYSLATGNWGDQKRLDKAKAGVSQVLSRYTFAATLSHMRRTNAPIGREGKIAKPRQLHNTHWGYVCPAETPEGQACGLVKNVALMSLVSSGRANGPALEAWIFDHSTGPTALEEWEPRIYPDVTKIFVNGVWFAVVTGDPTPLVNTMKRLRRNGTLEWDYSLVWDIREKEFRLSGDVGRLCRPLFTIETAHEGNTGKLIVTRKDVDAIKADNWLIENPLEARRENQPPFNWFHLVAKGAIEYLDAEEEEQAMIVMTPENLADAAARAEGYIIEQDNDPLRRNEVPLAPSAKIFTHCEIHPSMILGVCASIIPFPDHNQSPRNTYQSAMGKQAMGIFLTNFDQRMETMANILYYPQKPLARTQAMNYLKFRELPAGQNAIVAIACYSGYNQEDSVIMNQSSIDRGLFRSLFYRVYQEQEKSVGQNVFEKFEKPTRQDTLRLKHGTYDKLDEDGIISPGVRVVGEDIIMGKTAPMAPDAEELGQRQKTHVKRDVSIPLRSTESGVVDAVMLTQNADLQKFVKVRVRNTKVPQIGDKFASRHGQKGTIGITYRQEDMPFSRNGITPDIIINPHAIPSRMTIAHLIECLLSKVASLKGEEGDATPFTSVTVTQISELLRSMGYHSRGFEVMYNGHTGRKLVAQVFFGPTYYQRLRHMVDDKIHSRARGPTQILTRQPMEGRARDGGLRFGEMERDCMIAHGASSFMKERLFDVSDPFRVHVCDICGLMTVIAKLKKNTFECKNCNNKNKISQVYLPYAAKLLFQELWSMNIAARLYTKKS